MLLLSLARAFGCCAKGSRALSLPRPLASYAPAGLGGGTLAWLVLSLARSIAFEGAFTRVVVLCLALSLLCVVGSNERGGAVMVCRRVVGCVCVSRTLRGGARVRGKRRAARGGDWRPDSGDDGRRRSSVAARSLLPARATFLPSSPMATALASASYRTAMRSRSSRSAAAPSCRPSSPTSSTPLPAALLASWRARVRLHHQGTRDHSLTRGPAPPPRAWKTEQQQPQRSAPPPPPTPPLLERAASALLFLLPLSEAAYRLALLATYGARRSAADLLVWAGLQREGLLTASNSAATAAAAAEDAAASYAVAEWAARAGARLDEALADLARWSCEPVDPLAPLAQALSLPPALLSADALATAAALAALAIALAAATSQCEEQGRRAWQGAARAALQERRKLYGGREGSSSSTETEQEEEEGAASGRRRRQQKQQASPLASGLDVAAATAASSTLPSSPVGAATRWRPRAAPGKALAAALQALSSSSPRQLLSSASSAVAATLGGWKLQRPELLALSAISALLLRLSLAPIASQSCGTALAASAAAAAAAQDAAAASAAAPAAAATGLEAAAAAIYSPAVAALTGASGLVALVQTLGLLLGATGVPVAAASTPPAAADKSSSSPAAVAAMLSRERASGVPPRREPLAGAAEMLAAARASARFHLLLAAGDVATAALFGCGSLPLLERVRLV